MTGQRTGLDRHQMSQLNFDSFVYPKNLPSLRRFFRDVLDGKTNFPKPSWGPDKVLVIHGGRNSGKTTFVRLCELWIEGKAKTYSHFEVGRAFDREESEVRFVSFDSEYEDPRRYLDIAFMEGYWCRKLRSLDVLVIVAISPMMLNGREPWHDRVQQFHFPSLFPGLGVYPRLKQHVHEFDDWILPRKKLI